VFLGKLLQVFGFDSFCNQKAPV